MAWSLGYLPPREPELLDEFFLAVGKALYLANGFEAKCRHIVRLAKLVDHHEETGDATASLVFVRALKAKMLGRTIMEMRESPIIHEAHIQTLERAKDARNFIAHEGANVGEPSSVSARQLDEQLHRLRKEVGFLTIGDNLVSRWVYEIENREPAPAEIQEGYLQMIDEWIFGDRVST